jgi:hypothetical protein
MPKVGGTLFPYTKKGYTDAAKAKKAISSKGGYSKGGAVKKTKGKK